MNELYKHANVITFLDNETSVNEIRKTLREKILNSKISKYFTFDAEKRQIEGVFIYKFDLDIFYYKNFEDQFEEIIMETREKHQCVFMINGYVF